MQGRNPFFVTHEQRGKYTRISDVDFGQSGGQRFAAELRSFGCAGGYVRETSPVRRRQRVAKPQ